MKTILPADPASTAKAQATPELTPNAAAAELLRRRRARESLAEFARSVSIPGTPLDTADPLDLAFTPVETSLAAHHVLMLEALQRCATSPDGRLIIIMPPGTAKSTYTSVVTPAWLMGRTKDYRVIITSYASQIAEKHSKRCRQLVSQAVYRSIWPTRPELVGKAADQWSMTNGSEYMAAGLLAGLTGNRADFLIVDDAVANQEDADSKLMQQKTMDEFVNSAMTRVKPHGSVAIVMTHWNMLDLIGQILPENFNGESGPILCRDGQVWEVLHLAAECVRNDDPLGRKPGEFLWPEYLGEQYFLKFKNNPRARRTWSALFQGLPAPDAGIHFQREMFRRFDPDLPPGSPGGPPNLARGYLYGASDWATLNEDEARDPDFTEHGVACLTPDHNLYLLDWWYKQASTDIGTNAMIALIRRWKTPTAPILRWWHEGGVIDKAIAPSIRRAMRDNRAIVAIDALPSMQDKLVKLTAFHGMCSAGLVYLPLKRPWAERLIDLLCAFPAAAHDDGPDVCGLFGRGVDQMIELGLPRDVKAEKSLKPFTQEWLHYKPADKNPVRYI